MLAIKEERSDQSITPNHCSRFRTSGGKLQAGQRAERLLLICINTSCKRRAVSAITMLMPTSNPSTSLLAHPVKTLQALSESRLEEGRISLANSQWTGACYMTGLAVECALKACLARTVKEHDYPDKTLLICINTSGKS